MRETAGAREGGAAKEGRGVAEEEEEEGREAAEDASSLSSLGFLRAAAIRETFKRDA